MVPLHRPLMKTGAHLLNHRLKLETQLRVKPDCIWCIIVHQDSLLDKTTRCVLKDLTVRRKLQHMTMRRMRLSPGFYLHRDALVIFFNDIIWFAGEPILP
jgi:hypothetical protein